jgi:uncharacterized ParB-like nuclease family protein
VGEDQKNNAESHEAPFLEYWFKLFTFAFCGCHRLASAAMGKLQTSL